MIRTVGGIFKLALATFAACVFLVGGCRSKAPLEPMDASHLYFQGNGTKLGDVHCGFDLQTIYYGNWPIDMFLQVRLSNQSQEQIVLDASSDEISIVITPEIKYKVPIPSEHYSTTLNPNEQYGGRFKIFSDSLQSYARKKKIAYVEYRLGKHDDVCEAKPQV